MNIPSGGRVHVCDLTGCLGLGTIGGTWFAAPGVPHAYSVLFDDGGVAWIDAAIVWDIAAVADRNPASFSRIAGQA